MGEAKNRKSRGLVETIRERAWQNNNGLFVPRVEGDTKRPTWPQCGTCKRDVDSINVEDVGKDTVTIRAKCHNEEAVIKIEFPFSIRARSEETEWSHVQTAINSATFFGSSH